MQEAERASKAALAEAVRQIPVIGPILVSAAEEYSQALDEKAATEVFRAIAKQYGQLKEDTLRSLGEKVGQDKALLLILIDLAVQGTMGLAEIKDQLGGLQRS